jgi:diguanylate cyclase (GGDEF)-like protein
MMGDENHRSAFFRLALVPLLWCMFAAAAHAEVYPRAAAAETALRVATAFDASIEPFDPVIPSILGLGGQTLLEKTLAHSFHAMGAYNLSQKHFERYKRAALANADVVEAAKADVALGEIDLTIGDYASAESVSHELADLAERASLPWAQASAKEYLGVLDRRHGNLDSAEALEERALELRRALNDQRGIGTVLSNLGTIARDRGDFARALDLHLQALAVREHSGDDLELTLRNLALIYRELGDDATTRRYFERALDVARHHGDSSNYVATLGTYASYLADIREFDAALAAADESLAIARVIGNLPAVAFELLDSGRALLGLGRITDAVDRLNEALALGRELHQHEIVGRSQVALAEAALSRGERQRARSLLQETFADPQAHQYKPLLAQAYAVGEKLAIANGETSAALDYAHQQAALREDLLGTRASRRLSALESQYARAASEQQLVLVTKDNQLQAERLTQERLQRNFGIAVILAASLLIGMLAWRFVGMRRLNHALGARNVEIESQRAALSGANARLEHQAHELYQAAITDPLTGVLNRGHVLRQLDARIVDCTRDARELAVLLIDFDNFKQINDTRGHVFGDRVLVAGVQTMRQWLEPGDLLGRYGGEEFIVVASDRDPAAIMAFAERLRVRVAETLTMFAPELTAVATISVGIARLAQMTAPVRLEMLIEAADKAVYAAKAAGRNRVVKYVE